jgi:hypothetical protein
LVSTGRDRATPATATIPFLLAPAGSALSQWRPHDRAAAPAESSLCHDLDRQGQSGRAIAFVQIRAPHGRGVSWSMLAALHR